MGCLESTCRARIWGSETNLNEPKASKSYTKRTLKNQQKVLMKDKKSSDETVTDTDLSVVAKVTNAVSMAKEDAASKKAKNQREGRDLSQMQAAIDDEPPSSSASTQSKLIVVTEAKSSIDNTTEELNQQGSMLEIEEASSSVQQMAADLVTSVFLSLDKEQDTASLPQYSDTTANQKAHRSAQELASILEQEASYLVDAVFASLDDEEEGEGEVDEALIALAADADMAISSLISNGQTKSFLPAKPDLKPDAQWAAEPNRHSSTKSKSAYALQPGQADSPAPRDVSSSPVINRMNEVPKMQILGTSDITTDSTSLKNPDPCKSSLPQHPSACEDEALSLADKMDLLRRANSACQPHVVDRSSGLLNDGRANAVVSAQASSATGMNSLLAMTEPSGSAMGDNIDVTRENSMLHQLSMETLLPLAGLQLNSGAFDESRFTTVHASTFQEMPTVTTHPQCTTQSTDHQDGVPAAILGSRESDSVPTSCDVPAKTQRDDHLIKDAVTALNKHHLPVSGSSTPGTAGQGTPVGAGQVTPVGAGGASPCHHQE